MNVRQEMVSRLQPLFSTDKEGNYNFIFGSYKEEPTLPYGNYGRNESDNYFSENHVLAKINSYTVRIVTADKDFELEETIENIFDELEIGYQVVTDEEIKKHKVHCTEWEIELLDGCR